MGPEGHAAGVKLVRDRPPGRKAVLTDQLAHQPHGCPLVPARLLDQDVEDFALLVDGAPQIHAFAGDPHDHLIQMPPITRPGAPLPQLSREEWPEFQDPAPDRFVGQVEPAFGKDILDVALAEREARI
jgi:hypothetical protein